MSGAPSIGVVEAPDIAEALRTLGFNVITGEGFRRAATEVTNALKTEPFPIIVADTPDPVTVPWTTVTSSKASQTIVIATADGAGALADKPEVRLEPPSSFNDLLAMLGYQGADEPIGSMLIDEKAQLVPAASFAQVTPAEPVAPVKSEQLPAPERDEQQPLSPTDFPAPNLAAAPAPAAPAPALTFDLPPAQAAPDVAVQQLVLGGTGSGRSEPTPTAITPTFDDILSGTAPAPAVAPVAPPAAATPSATPEDLGLAAPVADRDLVASIFGGAQGGAPQTPVLPQHTPEPEPVAAPAPTPALDMPPLPPLTPAEPAPAPAPAVAAPAHTAAQSSEVQGIDMVASRFTQLADAPQPRTRPGTKHGEVIIVAAARGGVGKSTTAIALAHLAAEMGLQAVLVDANRGQADVAKYLRLPVNDLPTVYDAYRNGDPAAAVAMPTAYRHLRDTARLHPLDFGIVLGPPAELADPQYASAAVYGDVIDYARSVADVVIVDTQIVEAHHTDLWHSALLPLVKGGAWLLALTDESAAGVLNLAERLAEFKQLGVPSARTLVLATKFLEFSDEDVAYFQQKFDTLGTTVGFGGIDDDFHVRINMGVIDIESAAIRSALDAVLLRVTDRPDLFSARASERDRDAGPKKGGLFGFLRKKKG